MGILNPNRDPITSEDLRDLFELVCVEVPLTEVRTWTPEERAQAEEWAVATHLKASDNQLRVPPRPLFVPSPNMNDPECRRAAQ